jgi:predicted RNA-binding Zn-ribbon protein involved in translation (DUF1610 family)
MGQPRRHSLQEMVEQTGSLNRSAMRRILLENSKLFSKAAGASHNHQYWYGGYWDHIEEVMNLTAALYGVLSSLRPVTYELWEALEVAFVHDLEKPWRQFPEAPCPIRVPNLKDKPARARFRLALLDFYGVVFNPRQINGLENVEGEFERYSSSRRAMWPLGALVHSADIISARHFPNSPFPGNDAWAGSGRLAARNPSRIIIECHNCATVILNEAKESHKTGRRLECPNCGANAGVF